MAVLGPTAAPLVARFPGPPRPDPASVRDQRALPGHDSCSHRRRWPPAARAAGRPDDPVRLFLTGVSIIEMRPGAPAARGPSYSGHAFPGGRPAGRIARTPGGRYGRGVTDRAGEVLVIGAGVAGLTTAVCLAESGLAVTVQASELASSRRRQPWPVLHGTEQDVVVGTRTMYCDRRGADAAVERRQGFWLSEEAATPWFGQTVIERWLDDLA